MTVDVEVPIETSIANGVSTTTNYSFTVLEEGDLVVTLNVAGVITVQQLTTHYTISGLGTPAGTVNWVTAPVSGAIITVSRDTPPNRAKDYQTAGDFLADIVNLDFDRIWLKIQELTNGIVSAARNTVRAPNGEVLSEVPPANQRGDTLLGFDSNGDAVVVAPSDQSASALALSLIDSTNANKGAGQIGYSNTLTYPDNTVGQTLKALELSPIRLVADAANTADADPGNGFIRWNNLAHSSATFLYIDDQTADAAALTTFWPELPAAGFLMVKQTDDETRWQLWKWTAAPVDGTGYRKFAVTSMVYGGQVEDTKFVSLMFIPLGAAGNGSGENAAGRHAVPIMANYMFPAVTNGCGELVKVETTAGRPDIQALPFDQTAVEHAMFSFPMPKSWNEGTVSYVPIWAHGSATTFGVAWKLKALAVSDNEAIGGVYGTDQVSLDTGGTTYRKYRGPESSSITLAGTISEEDMTFWDISRDPLHASDTLDSDALLIGIVMYITTDAPNDDV